MTLISIDIQTKRRGLFAFQEALQKARNLCCKAFENDIVIFESQKHIEDVFSTLAIEAPSQLEI